MEALTTVKPYCNEIHAQAQLWLKRDPKASYEAWKKCLPIRGVLLPSRHSQQPLLPPGLDTYPCLPPLPCRGGWQWEIPQQVRAPPSLLDREVRVEVETVPEPAGEEDHPT